MIKHIILRIIALILLLFLATRIAYIFIDTSTRCATGDIVAIAFCMLISFILWIISLIIEAIYLHRKKQYGKRNFNLITAIILPIIITILYIFAK